MSNAILWPYGKCVECANKSDCVNSQAQIIACISNGYPDYKPQTNADRIRAMTDEEIAEILESDCPSTRRKCPDFEEEMFDKSYHEICKKCWLDWLRQEAKE